MSRDLYISLHNMITDKIAKSEACRLQFVEYIDDNFNTDNACLDRHTLEIIARENKRIKELSALLEQFETEVPEPEC